MEKDCITEEKRKKTSIFRRMSRGKKACLIVASLFVLFSVASMIIIDDNFDKMFARTQVPEYSASLTYDDVQGEYHRELVKFASGDHQLQGYLYDSGEKGNAVEDAPAVGTADGKQRRKGLVVISHGLGGGAQSYFAETMYFLDNGYRVFAFDNTGCYQSEGESCVGLSHSAVDLDAALTYIESDERFAGLPVFLYGHSWGGYAVCAVQNFEHRIAAAVSVAGFNDPMEMVMEWAEGMMGKGLAAIEKPYIYIYEKITMGNEMELTAIDGINNGDVPVLLIHGSEDDTVDFDGAAIVNKRDEITNPNVEYMICSKENQNDHNSLFMDAEAVAYVEKMNEKYGELYEAHDGEIPETVKEEFYGGLDKEKMSRLDDEFMSSVLSFYEEAAL